MNRYQREIDCLRRTVDYIYITKSVMKKSNHTEEFMKGWEQAHDFIMTSLCHVVDELEEQGKEDEENTEGRA